MTTVAASASASRRMSREDVVRLGQSGRPWEFVALGFQAVRAMPGDDGLRVLLAANLARLGLRTAAREELGKVGAAAAGDAAVVALTRAVEGLPEDRIDPESLAAQCL